MKKFKNYKLLILVVLGFVFSPGNLSAQVFCAGPSCPMIPLSGDALNELLMQFQYQYSDELLTDMQEANSSTTLTGTPGSPLMNGNYYAALTLPVGYEARHDIWIVSPRYQTGTALESAGVSFLPRLQFGFRYPMSKDGEDRGFLEKLLSRFEFYGSYFNYTYQKKVQPELDMSRVFTFDLNSVLASAATGTSSDPTASLFTPNWEKGIVPSDGLKIKWHHSGLMARFRIFENFDLAGSMVEFAGLSASVGYYEDRFSLNYLANNQKNKFKVTGGDTMDWEYSLLANYRNSTVTIPVEARSGITLLTFLQLNAGVGVAYSHGNYSLDATMVGPVTVTPSDLMGQIALYLNPITTTTYLGFHLRSAENVNTYTPYFRPGLEFHMGAVRVGFEGIMMKGASDTFIINCAIDI